MEKKMEKKEPSIFFRIFSISWGNKDEAVAFSKFNIPILLIALVFSGIMNYFFSELNPYIVSSIVLIIITIIFKCIVKVFIRIYRLQQALDWEKEKKENVEKELDGMNRVRVDLDNKIKKQEERISDLKIENRNLKI